MFDAQFLAIASITMLAVISPGPDFAVTLRNSLSFGRHAGVLTALGIASGVTVHIAYTLLGLSYLIQEVVWLAELIRYAGAAYLIWMGIGALRSPKEELDEPVQSASVRHRNSFRDGFICNALNPKTSLFFIALFSQVVDPQTPLKIQAAFGVFIAMAHLAWFAFVAFMLTHGALRMVFDRWKDWIIKGTGLCLVAIGGKLLLD